MEELVLGFPNSNSVFPTCTGERGGGEGRERERRGEGGREEREGGREEREGERRGREGERRGREGGHEIIK